MKRAVGWGFGIAGFVVLNAVAPPHDLCSGVTVALIIGGILISMGSSICDAADHGQWPWEIHSRHEL